MKATVDHELSIPGTRSSHLRNKFRGALLLEKLILSTASEKILQLLWKLKVHYHILLKPNHTQPISLRIPITKKYSNPFHFPLSHPCHLHDFPHKGLQDVKIKGKLLHLFKYN
jgi:hypothetical protein